MTIKRLPVPAIAPPSSRFAHGVEVKDAKRVLYVSGQLGVAPDGKLEKGSEAQIERVWRNVLAILEEAGMGPENVVKINGYLTRREDVRAYREIRDRMLGGVAAASTLVVVSALVIPEATVEIEVVAAA
jgi:enamine deaminase RidA (YjgF/YER057c/UK114 family)